MVSCKLATLVAVSLTEYACHFSSHYLAPVSRSLLPVSPDYVPPPDACMAPSGSREPPSLTQCARALLRALLILPTAPRQALKSLLPATLVAVRIAGTQTASHAV